MATRIRSLSSYILLLCLVESCWLNNVHAFDIRENHYHTLQISSLLPENHVCTRSTKGSNNRKASVEVFNRHGPCSSQDKPNEQPSLAEILSHDQSRVDSIQARLALNSDMLTNDKLRDKKTTLPAQRGTSLGSGNYFVTVGIGTPQKQLSLIFDTGSDLTWTQCEPCAGACYNQKQEKLDPAKSRTYNNITCKSPFCSQLKSATGITPGCSASTCVYGIQYGDKSFSVGFFAKERLTLTARDIVDDILFGCGQNNQGLFGTTAGLLGLGRDPLSVVSQTAARYKKFFSYCLPSAEGSGGHLTFGNNGVPRTVKYTPFADSAGSFYTLTLAAISVGGRQLPISSSVLNNPGTIIDSGTVVTRLPTPVYKPLRDAFRQQMTIYKMAPPISILDTCYDLSNYTTVKIPTISFYFSGNVKVDVVPNGILIVANGASQVCLAFAEDGSLSIFGNLQQQTLEVVYDVAGGKLGFAPNGCT